MTRMTNNNNFADMAYNKYVDIDLPNGAKKCGQLNNPRKLILRQTK
jgi:hypothetical protein